MPNTPLALVLALAALAPAQTPPAEQLPPQVTLGRRVDALRMSLKVRPTVVLASTPDDFVRAIERWTPAERFPILIDDGSPRAREDIARFVRAFQPRTVLRWKPDTNPDTALPKDPAALRETIERASRLAWDAESAEQLEEAWSTASPAPFGVVVASPADPAWAGGLALAVGRAQPFIWLDSTPTAVSQFISEEQAQALGQSLTEALDDLGHPWRGQGDDIDGIALCLNTGLNINAKAGRFALTDSLARVEGGRRAACVGAVHGDHARSVYRAMCALFLQPRSAWLFDGYKAEMAPPYALPAAAKIFAAAKFEVSTNTPPLGGLSHWRQRTLDGVNFDLIHVNSSGNADFFDLTPGRAFAGDVPFLGRPTIVHMIHSFSVQNVSAGNTIGGRWLENGAYIYYGSMDEPYLGAFLPAQMVATRLNLGAPIAASVRQDDTKVWKLNLFGDPLATFGSPAPRFDEPLELEGAANVEEQMKAALRAQNLEEGVEALVLLGRDKIAVSLARAALAEGGKAVTAAFAVAALPAAFREASNEVFYSLFERLLPDDQHAYPASDMLWQVARDELSDTEDKRVLGWLRGSIRDESMCDDAEAIAPAIRRVFGVEAVRSMYGGLLQRAKAENVRQRLQKEAARY